MTLSLFGNKKPLSPLLLVFSTLTTIFCSIVVAGFLIFVSTPLEANSSVPASPPASDVSTSNIKDDRESEITVEKAYAYATPPGANNGAVFLTLHNRGELEDALIEAETPAAASTELHTHIKEQEILKMRPVPAIDLPPGDEVSLAPMGNHIMLFSLTVPLTVGSSFPVTLKFKNAPSLLLHVDVIEAGTPPAHYKKKDTSRHSGEQPMYRQNEHTHDHSHGH